MTRFDSASGAHNLFSPVG